MKEDEQHVVIRKSKLTLIAEATKRKGAGVTPKPGYSIPEQHREFLKAKKGTHGDYEPKR